MEMNGNLTKEVNRINKALSDIWCKAVWGVTTDELVKNIIKKVSVYEEIKKKHMRPW